MARRRSLAALCVTCSSTLFVNSAPANEMADAPSDDGNDASEDTGPNRNEDEGQRRRGRTGRSPAPVKQPSEVKKRDEEGRGNCKRIEADSHRATTAQPHSKSDETRRDGETVPNRKATERTLRIHD